MISKRLVALILSGLVLGGMAQAELAGFIGLKDGYFYDKTSGEAFVPHGIAYQNWNRPLGVWQTLEQIDYDLDEIVKMGANSVRIDIVWQHVEEDGDNQFKWDNYDYFIQACEDRGLRIFALIGYQWPPNWFPDAWYTQHPPEWDAEGIYHPERWLSDIINYEHPSARAQYAEWLAAVAGRYKNSKAIAGWIVGNESGYLGLWSGLLDGYDPESEQAFRTWCQAKYGTIAAANAVWGSSFANFDAISFVEQYRAYGVDGAVWADMVQWREDSIASFTAVGAVAAKSANTNHLISYSTVGMQWGEEDWRYHAEDRGKITEAAQAAGAPIDFFSVNNYPWSVLGHESQNGQWGISYTKKTAGVPVLYSETGFTSSETMWPGMNELRQGPLIRNSLWESLAAGAIGTHIFSWMDRPYITDREKGFGIVYADRRVKPALWTSKEAFNLMEQVDIHNLLMGSEDPTPDIAFLWTDANDSQYNRYECEMQQTAGALERLGFAPYFIDLQDLAAGAYTNYRAVILPRNMRVEDKVPGYTNSVLNFLLTRVIPAGVHVLATADLPGMQDFHGRPRPQAQSELNALFGIDASNAGGYEAPQRRREYVSWYWKLLQVDFNANSPINGYHCWPQVWKYSDEVKVTDGTVWATMDSGRNKGFEDSNTEVVKWDYSWGNVLVRSGWGWAFDGNNMVQMWGDAGLGSDFEVVPFGRYAQSAFLRSNSTDPLSGGAQAYVALEWYDQDTNLISVSESAHLAAATPGNGWMEYKVDAVAPAEAWSARRVIRIQGGGTGSVYVDQRKLNPGVVVKDHGAAKACIFLFSAGDQRPDGDLDGDPDVYAWQWRYDYFGAVVKDYFGIEPKVEVKGTNAYLCLADYRTLADGSTLWQVKNYMYDPNYPASPQNPIGGGASQTFTISSPLFEGKTIKAFYQAKIVEENSDGTIVLTLPPDGMEMLHVYDSTGVGEYEIGSSDGRTWGVENGRSSSTAEGPSSFPLVSVYTTYCSYARAPVIAGDRLYAVENYFSHMIGCWDAKTGSNLWHYTSANGINDSFFSRSITVADGTVFAATKNNSGTNYPDGALYAIDAGTGSLKWSYANPSNLYNAVAPVVKDGVVFTAFIADEVRAIYADTGALKWATTNRASASAFAGLSLGNEKVYQIYSGYLSAFDEETGASVFRVYIGRPWYAESCPVVVGDKVYVARNNTSTGVGVYDANTGSLLWDYPSIALNKFAAPAVGDGIMAIVGQPTNTPGVVKVLAYDATQTGPALWEYTMPDVSHDNITPVIANGAVYINADDLYVLDAATGALLYTKVHAGSDHEPFVKNGWVFVSHGNGYIEALSDGTPWGTPGGDVSSGVGYWKMDEAKWSAAAGDVKDASTNANHGRAYNGPTTTWGGQVLKAGSFDGVNDYVEIPNSPSLQVAGDMTLSFWIKPQNLGTARINPVDKSYGGEFALTIETSRGMSYYHGTARSSGKYWGWAALAGGTLKNGEWQHIAITRNAATRQMKSYLNGKLMKTATYSSTAAVLPTASTYPVRIAQGYTGVRMKGLMDEVKLASATLSDAEVAALAANRGPRQIVQIQDTPSVVHPMGDKTYSCKVGYDCSGRTDLTLKLAFAEKGDHGDGTPDEKYEQLEQVVLGNGSQNFWIWIPDPDLKDSDYISTPDGGNYHFRAWLEDAEGRVVAEAIPAPVNLEWGVRPTAGVPTNLVKGTQYEIPIEWENLYEYLPWETTPMSRNSAFPNRVALFRSTKTEAQFPGQLNKVNQVADWLEGLGYECGNSLDISFDNVQVSGSMTMVLMGAWSADAQQGTGSWGNSGWENRTFRVLVEGSSITRDGDECYLTLKGRTSGSYFARRVSLVKRDGTTLNGVDSTFAEVTFGGTWENGVEVMANDTVMSDPIAFDLAAGQDVFVTFWGDPGKPVVYRSGTSTASHTWTIAGTDRTSTIDWQALTISAQNAHVYCAAALNTLGLAGEPTSVDFSAGTVQSYGGQDIKPSQYEVLDDGATLHMWGNNWKAVALPYTVTPDTIIEFDFMASGVQGEINNIGLDEDLGLSDNRLFQLWGTQTWGIQNYRNYSGSGWTHYTIAVGPHYTGARNYLVLGNDADAGQATHCYFKNVQIHEGSTDAGLSFADDFSGGVGNWARAAGAANWESDAGAMRASRLGNSDNIMTAGDAAWTDITVSADLCYNKQGPYLNDAELYVRYQDRDNFVKVGIRNFYGFWRLKYTVRENAAIVDQGWIHEFAKADRPVEGAWYNLKVKAEGNTYTVYFDGEEVGQFTSGALFAGKIGLGSMAAQLGIWEPQKGYYFVDDDEYSFWAPEGQPQGVGHPLNLDWGYLDAFYPTLILPGTYVMSDIEVSNVTTWISGGLRCLIATDGGVAMMNEAGVPAPGRIEGLFGVNPSMVQLSGLQQATIGGDGHYVTLDYDESDALAASGSAHAWNSLAQAKALAVVANGTQSVPALLVNTLTQDPQAPKKVFCFNFGVEEGGQLTGTFGQVAKRALEWAQGEACKVRLELKYPSPLGDVNLDLPILTVDGWILTGSGQTTLVVDIPSDGIMTGTNLYWVMYVHPWDAEDAWVSHGGFYSSGNDSGSGLTASLEGKGLQILGVASTAYAGREWDTWVAYNTQGKSLDMTFGVKKKGALEMEDSFDDGNYTGWTVASNPNIAWSVPTSGVLRASCVSTGGYAYVTRSGLNLADQNITIEYDVYFAPGATGGGVVYRGKVLYLNPAMAGWNDATPQFFTDTGLYAGAWHRVTLSIRDGDPYLMSDLYVDGKPVFLSEPIETTSWTSATAGFLSPYSGGYAEWNHVRIADEEYSFVTIPVQGTYVPTDANQPSYYSWIPDYDPDWWEFEGTALGGQYEWYTYLRGEGVHSRSAVNIYFAPRLMVESSSFPVEMNAGDTVQVPVEWEQLGTNLPVKLAVALQHVGSQAKCGETIVTITQDTGSAQISVSVSTDAPDGEYMWVAYMYPPSAINPFTERLGFDDTYRSDSDGMPVEPEIQVIVHGAAGVFPVYSDAGLSLGSDLFKWPYNAYVDADYTLFPAPEGSKSCYALSLSTYIGWGVFKTVGTYDMSSFEGGSLKFWLWSMETLKVEVEAPRWTKGSLDIPSTAGVWKEITIPLSTFSALDLSQVYGLFMITSYDGAEYMVDHVRWVQPEQENATEVNFNTFPVIRYDTSQDANSTQYEVLDGGETLHMWGNNWKCVDLTSYAVTANTVLEFDFMSTGVKGEINGCGLDTDLYITAGYAFQVFGTQAWGLLNYNNYSGSGWKHYSIPIGQHYTGNRRYLFFANDADARQATSVYYKNVRLVEP